MKNFINFLPPWVETNMQPAFYDKESGSCLQQTARMYAKVNQLVRIANEQWEAIQDYINKFIEFKNYVEDYFDNLDVQEEINNKLDEMAESGELGEIMSQYVTPLIDELDEKIDDTNNDLNDRINNLVSSGIAPIPVSSTSAMTDHNRIYVNTTNGKWYYWNGSAWTSGGTYQSSEDSTTLTLTQKSVQGIETRLAHKIQGVPVVNTSYAYINGTTGQVVSDYSRLLTDYVDNSLQRITCDSGYSMAVYFFDQSDVYQGRLMNDLSVSTSASTSSVYQIWVTDCDVNAMLALYPSYKVRLVFRKDDYTTIDTTTFFTHFVSYVKEEAIELAKTQNDYLKFVWQDMLAVGDLKVSDGTIDTSVDSRLYTVDFLPEYIDIITTTPPKIFKFLAYKKTDNAYVGRMRSNGTFGTNGEAFNGSLIDLRLIRKAYPDYKFKFVSYNPNSTAETNLLNTSLIKFYMVRKNQDSYVSEYTPDVIPVSCPNTANHDMTWIENKLFIFDAPTEQYNGKLSILNEDLSLAKTKYTNFNYLNKDGETTMYLRMKSVDYNPTNQILIVGNGQGPIATNDPRMFIFYEASSWYGSNTTDITFSNCGDYNYIDLSDLGDRAYCFWKNYGVTNEVYVTIDNLKKVFLIELAKGTTRFGKGTYTATSNNRYNGTYRIISCWKQQNDNPVDLNAHGGQVYKGKLYLASNVEEECAIYECIFNMNGTLQFNKINLNVLDNATIKYSFIDGMSIKDNIIYSDPLNINGTYHTGSNKVILKTNI